MKLRDLLTKEAYEKYGDVDVYDDYDERVAVAWCGTVCSEVGEEKFHDALELEAERTTVWGCDAIVVHVDNSKEARILSEIMYDMAGYCTEEEYNKWFEEV